MEIVKLPKKFRETCYKIMDGDYSALSALETFVKYPHQILAVKAELAYFNLEYDKALNYDIEILPYFDEWHYANVGNEHRAAMVVAALKLGREKELMRKFDDSIRFLKQEDTVRQTTLNNISILKSYLKKKQIPYIDSEDAFYQVPQDPLSMPEIKEKLKTIINKKYLDTPYGSLRLFYLTCQQGTPEDAAKAFDNIPDGENAELAYLDAIKLFHFLGDKDKTVQIIEKYATSRLWHIASATQIRPMVFFNEPVLVEYLTNPDILHKIRKASEIDSGEVVRK